MAGKRGRGFNMREETRQSLCDSLILTLLRIKRGQVEDEKLTETLESLKDGVDVFLRAAEHEIPFEVANGN